VFCLVSSCRISNVKVLHFDSHSDSYVLVEYVLLLELDAVNIQIPFLTVLMLRGPDFNFDSPNV
jgi:hypothetical protein